MPQKVEIDGEEKTVYSEEEVKDLKAGHDANLSKKETLTKLQAEIGLGEGEKLEDKIKELKELANPNFKEARNVIKSLRTALKEKGVEVDENGRVKSNEQGLSAEDIQKMIDDKIAQGISSATSKLNKNEALSGYSAEDRAKIEPVLDKLMALGGTIEENLELAEAKVFPGGSASGTKKVYNNAVGGGVKVGGDNKDNFADTPEAKSLGNAMGLSSFKEKKS